MSKHRYINTKFWDDEYIMSLDPSEKLLFLYFLTNPMTSICGIYEITLKRIAFDTGIDKDMVIKILERFSKDEKMLYRDGWIAIKKFINHQKQSENPNDNINKGIKMELLKPPKVQVDWILTPLKPLGSPSNYSYLDSNSNSKLNICSADAEKHKHLEVFEFWNSQPSLQHHKEYPKQLDKLMKNHPLSKDQILHAILNYSTILANPNKYFFTYSWTLVQFIQRGRAEGRGCQMFVDDICLKNFIVKKSNIQDTRYIPRDESESSYRLDNPEALDPGAKVELPAYGAHEGNPDFVAYKRRKKLTEAK